MVHLRTVSAQGTAAATSKGLKRPDYARPRHNTYVSFDERSFKLKTTLFTMESFDGLGEIGEELVGQAVVHLVGCGKGPHHVERHGKEAPSASDFGGYLLRRWTGRDGRTDIRWRY